MIGAALVVPLAAPAGAAAAQSGTAPRAASTGALLPEESVPWNTRDESTRAPVAAVLGGMRTSSTATLSVVSVHNEHGTPAVHTTTVSGRGAATAAIAKLQADPTVVSIGLDTKRQVGPRTGGQGLASNDQYWPEQWDMQALGVENVWAQGITGTGVTVAVIDSGVQGNHPDLAGRVLQGTDYVGSGNGWNDKVGHGTHVAGTIAAIANNTVGVAGAAPGAKILPVRVADENGWALDSDTVAGIIWAVKHGAQVLNLSLGGDSNSAPLATAVRYAEDRNALVVAAAGNDREGLNAPQYPAANTGVLAVAATGKNKVSAAFSNSGSYVGVAAPGVDIISTWSTVALDPGQYALDSGTSMATPHVAALAALAMQASGNSVRGARLKALIEGTTVDVETAGYDKNTGFGLINPAATVLKAQCLANKSCSMPLANVQRNPGQRYVQQAFVVMSGREPGNANLLRYTSLIAAKGNTAVTNPLTGSSGYRTHRAADFYAQALERTPSSASISLWARRLGSGWSQPRAFGSMLASAEAVKKAGGTNAAWVTSLYQKVLGRSPSPAGTEYWMRQLRAGASRDTIATRFVNSDAALNAFVVNRFQAYLNRGASAASQKYWRVALKQGRSWQALDSGLVATSEFRAKT